METASFSIRNISPPSMPLDYDEDETQDCTPYNEDTNEDVDEDDGLLQYMETEGPTQNA